MENIMSVRRFFWVRKLRSRIVHLDFVPPTRVNVIEGDKLACGRIVSRNGLWHKVSRRSKDRICSGCWRA
jgi:hypothetical protein